MHWAVVLAERHGEALPRAATAGLLHDCGRFKNVEDVQSEVALRGVEIPDEDRDYPGVWHAYLAAEIAARDFGVRDEGVLDAIRYHPTGTVDMSRLAKILFLADYTEPTRRFDGLTELRALAGRDLDAAYRAAAKCKLQYIRKRGRPMHPRAMRAFESIGGTLQEVDS